MYFPHEPPNNPKTKKTKRISMKAADQSINKKHKCHGGAGVVLLVSGLQWLQSDELLFKNRIETKCNNQTHFLMIRAGEMCKSLCNCMRYKLLHDKSTDITEILLRISLYLITSRHSDN